MLRKRKPSLGKQKIEIKKIEDEEARQVSFSKRKHGIFSKANELAILCGAKVAILIQSPGGHPYSFGSPSFGHVTDMFLHGGSGSTDLVNDAQLTNVQQLSNNLMEVGSNIQDVKKKKSMLINRIKELSQKNEDVWRIENAEYLNLAELKRAKEALERFKGRLETKLTEDMATIFGSTIATTKFSELGSSVDNVGTSHVSSIATTKTLERPGTSVDNSVRPIHGFDLNVNLIPDDSFDQVAQMNPYFKSYENDAGPSEPPSAFEHNKGIFATRE